MRGSNSESDKPPPQRKVQPSRPPIQWVPGTLSLWVKQPGREADRLHLVPKLRMTEANFSPPNLFMAWTAITYLQALWLAGTYVCLVNCRKL